MPPLARFALAVAFTMSGARLAAADSEHDIHFLAEHVPESGMDAHYMGLPWPGGRLEPGRRQMSVDVSAAHTETDFIDLGGPMLALASAAGVTEQWGYQAIGFYSDMQVSGDSGRVPLTASFLPVPLDLPQPADFTNPRGTLRHFGVGAAAVRELGPADRSRSTQLISGLLLERVDIAGYEMDYRLVSGADAGAVGVLDHSSAATFLTPFVSWQQTRTLGSRWAWSPRALFAMPVPAGDFDTRMTGPGFDVSTAQTGTPLKIGDGFATVGLALAHLRSGLEVDVGGMAFFPVGEHLSHPGVDRALIIHLAWRQRSDRQPQH